MRRGGYYEEGGYYEGGGRQRCESGEGGGGVL